MKTLASVSEERKRKLNHGEVETAHLVEALAMDLSILLNAMYPDEDVQEIPKDLGIVKRVQFAGEWIYRTLGLSEAKVLQNHPSDTARAFGCCVIGCSDLCFEESLEAMMLYADDPHFSVREWAWLAIRQKLAKELDKGISLLKAFSKSDSENIRRFVVELTRPRGVWCMHLNELKKDPSLAFGIFEDLYNDPSRYVQNSVANWLNDASKSKPDWVIGVCEDFLEKSTSSETKYICKRAQRSINKKNSVS